MTKNIGDIKNSARYYTVIHEEKKWNLSNCIFVIVNACIACKKS